MVNQRNDLRSRVRALEESNVELAEQVSRLRDDPATIEGLARTELGMVRDGETVYILSHRPEDPPK
ncbi:septum formation initiator family protein [bacterium]|nr:septum formation initiator family protein [bacterium]